MDPRESEHVQQFEGALETWTDQRFASQENIHDWAMFFLYLVNLAEHDGWVYDGHSITNGAPMCRLVVRGTVEGVPSVVFTSGRTPTGCVHTFLRKMREGWLEWSVDRFRS